MQIKITSDPHITQQEVQEIVVEEKNFYSSQNKTLAEIELTLENNEILVKSYEISPIRRIRRITGYLSEEHNFNTAKKAELHHRTTNTCA